MSYREQVSQWEQTVSSSLPHLSRPQAKVLALWSMTMIVVGSCGTTLVGAWLSCTVGGSEESWWQRLREWCYDAQDKNPESIHQGNKNQAECQGRYPFYLKLGVNGCQVNEFDYQHGADQPNGQGTCITHKDFCRLEIPSQKSRGRAKHRGRQRRHQRLSMQIR